MKIKEGGFKIDPIPITSPPPGTASWEALDKTPRMPKPPPVPHREIPPLPPKSERKGKWLSKYLDTLDPETEFDEIVRVANLFTTTEFNVNLGYVLNNLSLYQSQAAVAGFYTGHQALGMPNRRFYETANAQIIWVKGSNHPDSIKKASQINRLHHSVWAKSGVGTGSPAWNFQMALVCVGYLENYMRKVCGANEIGQSLKQAYPLWAEQVCQYIITEPEDGSRTSAINFPNNWKDYEGYFNWHTYEIDWRAYLGEGTEYRSIAHDLAETTIDQFIDNCMPSLRWIGRQMCYTLLPPPVRKTLLLPDPNPIARVLVLAFFRVSFFLTDNMPDSAEPVMPVMEAKLKSLSKTHFYKIDEIVREKAENTRKLHFKYFIMTLAIMVLLSAFLARFASGL